MEARQKTMKPFLELVENYHSLKKHNETANLPSNLNAKDMDNSAQKSLSTDLLPVTVMTKIWKRMVAIYGHKWSSHLGDAIDGLELSEAAKTWQSGLSGITVEQLGEGFKAVIASGKEWPPSLVEFRQLCLSGLLVEIPTLDEIVSHLVLANGRKGTLAARYRHPLALAVSRCPGVDLFALRTAKLVDAKRMIKPAYEQCLKTSWSDWTEADLKEPNDNQKAIGFERVTDKAIGRQAFCNVRSMLGMNRVADKLHGKSA
jgi:hypothetical protein